MAPVTGQWVFTSLPADTSQRRNGSLWARKLRGLVEDPSDTVVMISCCYGARNVMRQMTGLPNWYAWRTED